MNNITFICFGFIIICLCYSETASDEIDGITIEDLKIPINEQENKKNEIIANCTQKIYESFNANASSDLKHYVGYAIFQLKESTMPNGYAKDFYTVMSYHLVTGLMSNAVKYCDNVYKIDLDPDVVTYKKNNDPSFAKKMKRSFSCQTKDSEITKIKNQVKQACKKKLMEAGYIYDSPQGNLLVAYKKKVLSENMYRFAQQYFNHIASYANNYVMEKPPIFCKIRASSVAYQQYLNEKHKTMIMKPNLLANLKTLDEYKNKAIIRA